MTGRMMGVLIGSSGRDDECALFGSPLPPLNGRGIETIHMRTSWVGSRAAAAHWREARLEARRQRGREFVARLMDAGPPYDVATDDELDRLLSELTD